MVPYCSCVKKATPALANMERPCRHDVTRIAPAPQFLWNALWRMLEIDSMVVIWWAFVRNKLFDNEYTGTYRPSDQFQKKSVFPEVPGFVGTQASVIRIITRPLKGILLPPEYYHMTSCSVCAIFHQFTIQFHEWRGCMLLCVSVWKFPECGITKSYFSKCIADTPTKMDGALLQLREKGDTRIGKYGAPLQTRCHSHCTRTTILVKCIVENVGNWLHGGHMVVGNWLHGGHMVGVCTE